MESERQQSNNVQKVANKHHHGPGKHSVEWLIEAAEREAKTDDQKRAAAISRCLLRGRP